MAPPGDTPPGVCATPLPGGGPPWVPSLAVAPGEPALTAAPGERPSLARSALAGLAGFSFWTAVFGATGLPAAGPDVEPAVWAVAAGPEAKSIVAAAAAIYFAIIGVPPGTVHCNANDSPGYRFLRPTTPVLDPSLALLGADAKKFRLRATYGMSGELIEAIGQQSIGLGESYIGDATQRREALQVPDLADEPPSSVRDIILHAGYRGLLVVPLLRPNRIVGALVVRRKEPGLFPNSTIDLLQTFAAQSVLAIQNARLFEDVEARTRELAKSLEELRAAQDRLVQTEKLASLGQLTAGIAHEIKNPLNFVNNFAALSLELVEELRDVLESVSLTERSKEQIAEVTGLLCGNLGKVVQHGIRADSIVKNMLLHSRAGSGEHRLADINAIVEESLNLAYHGARAENQEFNIILERSLDPAAGEVDIFPQEITRVLLNFISNGFYAAMKRKGQGNGGVYAPTLLAGTRNLGDKVEIRIRDNGTGVPPEVKDKMFNPFFTTKPAGEGTGLGLSLSHDIIVKQHAGTIEVDTEPGVFTEFRIVLPRTGSPA